MSLVVFGNVWTGTAAQAEAVAIDGDRIVAVGSRAEIEPQIRRATRVIQTNGLVVPGFIDCHTHFLDGGARLSSVQLRNAKTREEFTRRIADYATTVPPGTWIVGGDWDHEHWGNELPHRSWIDAVTPQNPVWVNRLDGHMALANSLALDMAGVSRATADVTGGSIVRDSDGSPTGVLKDQAMQAVLRVVPPPDAAARRRSLKAAMQYVGERGVTSIHHMCWVWDELEVFRRAHADGELTTRLYVATPLAEWERLRDFIQQYGRGDDWLRIGALKGFVDGSLGSHTAAFIEPYTDQPSDRGLLLYEPADLQRWTADADRAGLHVAIHAIGDRAVRTLLDLFERVTLENGARDRRFRMEHAQHVTPADVPRFAPLGVIPSMQPTHAIDDGRWAERLVGARVRDAFPIRALIDAGARPAFGSDWFVAPPDPLLGIYAAVTRRTTDGQHPQGWIPEQKISVDEALRAYTTDAAFASFEEEIKGSLSVGMLADVAVIDRDITAIPPEEIADAQVTHTVAGGRVIYERS